jgi:hypothetical protein
MDYKKGYRSIGKCEEATVTLQLFGLLLVLLAISNARPRYRLSELFSVLSVLRTISNLLENVPT